MIRKTLPFSVVLGLVLFCLGVGCILSPGTFNVGTCDYWDPCVVGADVATKETLALNNVLQSFGNTAKNSWVNVDRQALLHFWNRRGSRSHSLVTALKCLFKTKLSGLLLSSATCALVQSLYGGPKGHSIDLMARASNVQTTCLVIHHHFFLKVP